MKISRAVIPIIIIIIWIIPDSVFGQEITGDDFIDVIPEETETFTLQRVEPSEDVALVKADYIYNPLEVEIPFYIAYGEDSEKVREYSTDSYSSEGFTYGADNSDLEEKLDEIEDEDKSSYRIQSDLQQGLGKKILSWEMTHGNLQEEYPLTQLLPTNVESFGLSDISNKSSTSVRASYKSADDEQTMGLQLYYGERARQEYELAKCKWDEQESVDIDGKTYYGSVRESDMTVQAYGDNIFIELSLRDDSDNSDEQRIKELMDSFVTNFDAERFTDWSYPEGEELEITLSKEHFGDFFQEETKHFSLQSVEPFEDAMHVKAKYLFEPEDHEVTVHLAYREDIERLATVRNPLNNMGDFRLVVEPNCLDKKVERSQFNSYLEELHEEVISEKDLTIWEMEYSDIDERNPLTDYFPQKTGSFNIVSLNREDEDLLVSGKYQLSGEEDELYLLLTYGDDAAQKYNQLQMALFENKPARHDVDGLSFSLVELDYRIVAFTYIDHLLISAFYRNPEQNTDSKQQHLIDFLSDFEPGRLTDFEAPDDYEMNFTSEVDGTKRCLGVDCFEEQLTQCNSAQFGGRIQGRLGALYEIEGSSGDNSCRLSFEYTRNPNSDLEEQPLYFTMDRDESFLESGPNVVEECLEGNAESRNCEGPLLEILAEE